MRPQSTAAKGRKSCREPMPKRDGPGRYRRLVDRDDDHDLTEDEAIWIILHDTLGEPLEPWDEMNQCLGMERRIWLRQAVRCGRNGRDWPWPRDRWR